MNLGIWAVIIWTVFGWVSNMLMKKVSKEFPDNYLALVFQYIAMAIVALILGWLWAFYHGTAYIPSLSAIQWILVVGVWIVGYIGILFLFRWYDYLCGGVALVIANLATFLMYFINLALYPGQEAFSIEKILLAIIFFIIIAQFLLDQGSCPINHRNIINKYTLYPLGTAVCWAAYYVGNSYFIKSWMMSPVQVGMITESLILVFALIWFAAMRWLTKGLFDIKKNMNKDKLSFFLIWLFNVVSVYLVYYWYQTNAANIVNVLKLFTIPFAAIFCRVFLKDRLTKKQTILLVIGFLSMVWFLYL